MYYMGKTIIKWMDLIKITAVGVMNRIVVMLMM